MRGCIAGDAAGGSCGRPGIVVDAARGGMVCAAHAPQTPLLRYSIRRAMGYPATFLAAALAELTDEAIASALGCAPGAVWPLRLARWPGPAGGDAEVAHLAATVGCSAARLGALLGGLSATTDTQ